MKHDVAVVGAPFLDLTFEGLEELPRIGEEVLARALHVGPGGTGMQAIACARLGLVTALVAPLADQGAALLLRETIEREGVRLLDGAPDPRAGRPGVSTTALLATRAGVAMATVLEGTEPSAEGVARAGAAALLLSLGRLHLAPSGTRVFAVTGALELPQVDQAVLQRMRSARALVANAGEAAAISGRPDSEAAARWLARHVRTAVVTRGGGGVVAAEGERVERAGAPQVDVVDATGAGDLFAAAYLWADLGGAPLRDRLAWASLYAGLSVRAPTAFAGALRREELLGEGRQRGLTPPPDLLES